MDGGLVFVGMSLGFAVVFRQVQRLGAYIYERLHPPKPEHAAWGSYPREYLVALNELNILIPTDDPDEKDLARYLEETSPKASTKCVSGSFATLLAPGYSALFNQQRQFDGLAGLGNSDPSNQYQAALLQNQYGRDANNQQAPRQDQLYGMVNQPVWQKGSETLYQYLLGNPTEKH